MASAFEIPTITPQDLGNFHNAHLSLDLHEYFTHTFLQPQPQALENQPEHESEHPSEDYVEEGDDLGYYPDGTKRTLTSAQVAMFRFSEIQSLLKKRRRAATKKQDAKDRRAQRDEEVQPIGEDTPMPMSTGAEEGEVTELDRMKSRLQAAVWASSRGWDEQVPEEQAVPRVIETVDVGTGKNFLWPAIERGDW